MRYTYYTKKYGMFVRLLEKRGNLLVPWTKDNAVYFRYTASLDRVKFFSLGVLDMIKNQLPLNMFINSSSPDEWILVSEDEARMLETMES